MKAEKMLDFVADSAKMPGWNDSLSFIVNSTVSKSKITQLSDEDLGMVSAGVDLSEEMIKKLKFGKTKK